MFGERHSDTDEGKRGPSLNLADLGDGEIEDDGDVVSHVLGERLLPAGAQRAGDWKCTTVAGTMKARASVRSPR